MAQCLMAFAALTADLGLAPGITSGNPQLPVASFSKSPACLTSSGTSYIPSEHTCSHTHIINRQMMVEDTFNPSTWGTELSLCV